MVGRNGVRRSVLVFSRRSSQDVLVGRKATKNPQLKGLVSTTQMVGRTVARGPCLGLTRRRLLPMEVASHDYTKPFATTKRMLKIYLIAVASAMESATCTSVHGSVSQLEA